MTKEDALQSMFDILRADTPEKRRAAKEEIDRAADLYRSRLIKAKESATINKKDNFDEIVSAATRLAALLKESSLFGSDQRVMIMTAGSILQHDPQQFRETVNRLAEYGHKARRDTAEQRRRAGRKVSPFPALISVLKLTYRRFTKERIRFSRRPDGTPYGPFVDFVRAISRYVDRPHISDAQIEHAIRFAKTHDRFIVKTKVTFQMPAGWENWPSLAHNPATTKSKA